VGKKNTQEKGGDTKTRILREAELLFAEKGFGNTGIDEIARKVGIAKSVIYYHFTNKDEILKTMFQEYFQRGIEYKKQVVGKKLYKTDFDFKAAILGVLEVAESWEPISRIALMESVKSKGEVPLFTFWENNALITSEMFPDKIKNLTRDEIMYKGFFMLYMPLLSYLVFADRWCAQFSLKKERARELFAEAMSEYFEMIMKPLVWKE
jgi:AcrR family transcriptional regulator